MKSNALKNIDSLLSDQLSIGLYKKINFFFFGILGVTHLLYGDLFIEMYLDGAYLYSNFLPADYVNIAIMAKMIFVVSCTLIACSFKSTFIFILCMTSYLVYVKPGMDYLGWHDQNLSFFIIFFYYMDYLARGENVKNGEVVSIVPCLSYLYLALMFFSSLVHKLIESGLRWGDGRVVQYIFLEYAILHDATNGLLLVDHLWLIMVLSSGLMLMQLTFPLSFFFKKLRGVYIVGTLLFYLALYLVTQINFFKFKSMTFFVFAPYLIQARKDYVK